MGDKFNPGFQLCCVQRKKYLLFARYPYITGDFIKGTNHDATLAGKETALELGSCSHIIIHLNLPSQHPLTCLIGLKK